MLNELYAMSQSLARCGLSVSSRHKDLKTNPKADGFLLGIAEDGSVSSIEFISKEKMKDLWKIDYRDNLTSFPGFNITEPLHQVTVTLDEGTRLSNLKKDQITTRLEIIEQILKEAVLACSSNQQRRLQKNLREFPRMLQETFTDCPPDYVILSDLLTRLCRSTLSEEEFLRSLSDTGMQAFREGKLSPEAAITLQTLLLGEWDKKKERFGNSKTVLLLEPIEGVKYPFAITHPQTERFVNERLNERMSGKSYTKGGKGSVEKSGIDSMIGIQAEIETRFPNPNLPFIGLTNLMSMTKDSLSQTKYGLQESDTFPVGKGTTQAMHDALKFLTEEKREGETWRGVSNSERTKDLLIVYLEDKPNSEAQLADFFVMEDEDAITEGMFEKTAKKVCDALEGDPAINVDSLLRVIVITSRDKGRKQIALSEFYQVKEILLAAEEWQQAGRNLPFVSIPLLPKRGGEFRIASPVCPPPVALLKSFNTQWTNSGMNYSWINSCDLGQIYEVFLPKSAQSKDTAGRLLSLTLQRANSLLLAAGNRQHCNNWAGFPDNTRFAALTTLSGLGILLFKSGHRKEVFMSQAPYNIGRLLSLADQLHALYCKEVRDGSMPPQLFGNALMSTALQQPITALSLFAQRVLPYKAWADTVNTGESIGLAKYFLKEISNVSQILKETTVPANLTDADRAEMILGYLTSSRSENKENQ